MSAHRCVRSLTWEATLPSPTNRGEPLTAGQLAEALAKLPPDTPLWMEIGGSADRPWRVAWGNIHSPGKRSGFATIQGWEFGDDF